jgi:hypothetical protein
MDLTGWSAVGMWGGLAIVIIGMMTAAFLPHRHVQRRTYWLSWLAGGLTMTAAAAHSGPRNAWTIAVFAAVMSVMIAFFRSPYLKIGGTIFALSLSDRQPDPPRNGQPPAPPRPLPRDRYGNLSAATFWWIQAFLFAAGAVNVTTAGWKPSTAACVAVFTLALAMIGFADASDGFPIVRRQFVPALVLTASSVALLFIPPAAYVLGYTMGRTNRRRHPSRHDDAHRGHCTESSTTR